MAGRKGSGPWSQMGHSLLPAPLLNNCMTFSRTLWVSLSSTSSNENACEGQSREHLHSRCSLNANTRPSQNLRGLGHFQFLRLLIYFKNEGTLRQGCQNHSHNFKNIQIRKKYLEHIHTNIHPTHPIKIHASNMRESEVGMLQSLGPL